MLHKDAEHFKTRRELLEALYLQQLEFNVLIKKAEDLLHHYGDEALESLLYFLFVNADSPLPSSLES